jgi:parallel beta-helix repeat protein
VALIERMCALAMVLALAGCGSGNGNPIGPSGNQPARTVTPGQSIQAAIDDVPAGSTILVRAGTYAERLVITKALKLQGNQAVLDGLAGGLDGRFVGMTVRADNVEVSGFTIQNYERGIEVNSASGFRLHDSEIRNNTSKDPPPISAGVTKSDGVILFSVRDSEISDNFIHDNGSIGVLLMSRSSSPGSDNNIVQRNRFVNNGTQQGLPGSGNSGASVQLGAPGSQNHVLDNEMVGSNWGITIYGNANTIRGNRISVNSRAGIMVYGVQNVIEHNTATGNGSANFTPSCRHELMDHRAVDNTWRNNAGTFVSGEGPNINPIVSLFCP